MYDVLSSLTRWRADLQASVVPCFPGEVRVLSGAQGPSRRVGTLGTGVSQHLTTLGIMRGH